MTRIIFAGAAVALASLTSLPNPSAAAVAEATSLRFAPLKAPSPKAGRSRPLVVIVAAHGGAETTDFAIPYAVLKDSGMADVRSVSTVEGPVQLMRALKILPDLTTAKFDTEQPLGADIVVVPAQMNPKDEALREWLRSQAKKGAMIVSVCEGARAVAYAGLLEGRKAATHWSAIKALEKAYPGTTWVRDRRYVQDGPIVSTSGVSASIPMSLALVEAIGGHDVAVATARRMGVSEWSAAHRTADFALGAGDYTWALGASAAVWSHETVEFPVASGTDELALALQADAWTRTMRARVVTTGGAPNVVSKHGLQIAVDALPKAGNPVVSTTAPGQTQLERAFTEIAKRYGPNALRLAKIGMEYESPSGPSQ